MTELAGVVEALRAGDDDGALAALLGAWDATRAPEVADAIRELSARVTRARPALAITPQQKAHTAWVELARERRPGDVGRLMAALVEVLALGPHRLGVARLDELIEAPPDPRIAEALLVALAGPISGWSDKTYVRFGKLMIRHGDIRLADALVAAAAKREADHMDDEDRQRLAKIEPAWRKRAATPAPAELAEIRAAIAGAKTATSAAAASPKPQPQPVRTAAALLAAIYDNPADDDARQIYADALGERGDPRGEFIGLQIARAQGRGTPAGAKREAALLKAHRSEWLGPLGREIVIADTVWERGFPVATTTKLSKVHQAKASLVRPEWATFERITFTGAALLTEAMGALEEVRGFTESGAQQLAKLARLPPRLRLVELAVGFTYRTIDELPGIAAILAIPTLRAFEFGGGFSSDIVHDQIQRLHDTASARLERLGVGMARGGEIAQLLLRKSGSLRELQWGAGTGVTATALRDATGWRTLELRYQPPRHGQHWTESLQHMIEGFAPDSFDRARVWSLDTPDVRELVVARAAGVATQVDVVAVSPPTA